MTAAGSTTATAACDTGDLVTGGGFIASTGSPGSSQPVQITGTQQGWQATQTGTGGMALTAFAVCANVAP
ncbi:hypothetical protein [Streptomyces sp. NBC_00582]|uniref:hypothetical protein n=1 Tax=Streptomyces sp. NBC_00582 TaxID=2975783 RepID=UPI0010EB6F19|nr:hypothetical protein [Streptomyces sp. NBC_00582]WUB66661.1 hypothetical protein OG852_42735 [Streptomyces sp. NBC_00582]